MVDPSRLKSARNRFYPGWWIYREFRLRVPRYVVVCRNGEDCRLAWESKPEYVRVDIKYSPRPRPYAFGEVADQMGLWESAIPEYEDRPPTIAGESPLESPKAESEEWSDEKNSRRCELIDKEIEGTLTRQEKRELDRLQQQMVEYRRRVAPLPIQGARELHRQLVAKKREQEARDKGRDDSF